MSNKGRPAGARNVEETVDVFASRCPKCGSTEREGYESKTVQPYATIHRGVEYSHIVRRRCRCSNCGQTRIDRTYENVVGK